MNEQNLFLRGKFAGYRQSPRNYMKDGKRVDVVDHQVGIEKEIDSGFGKQKIYVTANIIQAKLNDAAFMKSCTENVGKYVEFPVFVGSFQTLLVGSESVITVIQEPLKQVS